MLINIIHINENQVSNTYPNWVEAQQKRRQLYLEEMAEQRAKFVVHDGVIDKPTFKGISKAHKKVVQYAKDNKLPMIVIMEDDCKFTSPNSYKYFLEKLPEDFDMFFGVIYHGDIGDEHRLMNGFSGGLTLYAVHERFYDAYLNVRDNFHLDNCLGELAVNHKFYVCDPFVCYQVGGYSYNHRKVLYYDEYLKGRKLYTG